VINIPSSPGVKLALLEAQLLAGEIDRSAFLERAPQFGLAGLYAASAADKFLAIAANQAARRENLKASYDYIVVGSGAAGSAVARRGVPGVFCASCNETNWNKRSYVWHEERSIRRSRS
jgi:hypothetical protein